MVWMALVTCCRVGRMASEGRRACLYRLAPPLPLGAGEYVRSAGVGFACGEGVGVSLRFSYLSARRCVISSPPPSPICVLASLPPSSSPSCPMRVVISHLRPMCFVFVLSAPPCSALCVLVWFLIALLPVPSTSRAGRSLLARLIRCGSRLSSRAPHLVSPCLIAYRGSSSPVPISCGRRPVLRLASARVSSSPRSVVFSPRSSTSVGGAGSGSMLLACSSFSPAVPSSSCGCRAVACLPRMAAGDVASAAGCVRFVVFWFVYINGVFARV